MARPKPSLRVQFVLSFLVAGAIVAGLIAFVDAHQNDSNRALVNPSAIAEQNREADIVVSQEQAPHVVRLPAHAAASPSRARAALVRAIVAYVDRQIALGTIGAPLQRVSCRAPGRGRFTCAVIAADLRYRFVARLDSARSSVVYCRKEPAPVPGEDIPLSHRCA